MKPDKSSLIASLLIVSLILTGYAPPAFSQEPRPIVITFGQPNIWSLEQAHYLLNRMHRQNLDLQTAPLGTLDPNAANASRIDILKTLLTAGVSFDQAVGLNNDMLRRDKVFNNDRRRQLLNNRSTLQGESTQLARDIAALRIAKANAETDAEKSQIQNSIDAKTEEKAAVDNELAQTNDEVKGMTSTTGEFQSAAVPSTSPTTLTGDLDSLIDQVELVNPSIAATLRLDNHIQLQYEIISKQLTLLRDEVGPGERLVFLELPQSINATQDRAANKMAQTWWRIAGYTKVDKDELLKKEIASLLKEINKIENLIKNLDKEDNDTKAKEEEAKRKNNAENKPSERQLLERQLDALCDEKSKREKELEQKGKELEAANESKGATRKAVADAEDLKNKAEVALEEARKTGNNKKIRAAEAKLEEAMRKLTLAKREVELSDARHEALCKELQHDLEELKDSIDHLDDTIKATRLAIQKVDDKQTKIQNERVRLSKAFTSLSTKYEKLRLEQIRNQIRKQHDIADRLIQGGSADTTDIVEQTFNAMPSSLKTKGVASDSTREECQPTKTSADTTRTYFNLEKCLPERSNDSNDKARKKLNVSSVELERRSVRTIDIIPRQNAINVQDTKQTLSRTGIFAAVSFLFGFAGKFTYERQREHAEQFLNQELFTSGFGKGEKDFGWSFYPFAGTKQLSSGVRTTYAVAIIPEEAESLILKARGCYFPRKDLQPLNYDLAGEGRWIDEDRADRALCTPDEQVFVVPVPGGSGDGADFYITDIRYSGFQEPGSRMIASIRGQNLPSQIGVLVDGVPLRQAVGLGQLNIESILGDHKTRDNCVRDICGRFERIDANEIVISFENGPDFTGTPRIELIGPGKAIELNRLYLTINSIEDTRLEDSDAMFGDRPDPNLRRIADFKVAPLPPVSPPAPGPMQMTGVLTGSRFQPTDKIFINGSEAKPVSPCRKDLCIVRFNAQETDFLTVTISPTNSAEKAISKTFVNPTNLAIISASVVSFVAAQSSNPAVLTVKLDGTGFKNELIVRVVKSEGPPDTPQKIVASSGQMFLRIVQPEAVVQIKVQDPGNNREVSAVVVRP